MSDETSTFRLYLMRLLYLLNFERVLIVDRFARAPSTLLLPLPRHSFRWDWWVTSGLCQG
jgi:hypothetical protein